MHITSGISKGAVVVVEVVVVAVVVVVEAVEAAAMMMVEMVAAAVVDDFSGSSSDSSYEELSLWSLGTYSSSFDLVAEFGRVSPSFRIMSSAQTESITDAFRANASAARCALF